MGRRYEVDGYTAELDDGFQVIYRNPRGKKLQQIPDWLADSEGVRRLYRLRRALTGHRRQARVQAEAWATAGTRVPMALAESDPVWREAFDDAGVEPVADPPPAPDADEAALIARTYVHPDDHTMTLLLRASFARHWDAFVASQEDWALTDTFATGIRVPGDTEPTFPERLMAAHPGREQEALEAVYAFGWSLWGSPTLYKSLLDGDLAHLAATAPRFLPAVLDELADMCLKAGGKHQEHATGYFTRARNAEREQHTKPDERWLDARYATFADHGALATGAVRARAKELAPRGAVVSPDQLRRFRDVLVRRVHTPHDLYPGMAADLRKVARAAGANPESEVAALLADIVPRTGLCAGDTDKFWADALKGKALELLVERRPETVHDVLRLIPDDANGTEDWLSLLRRSGALALLTGEHPGLPAGEAARLLHDFLASEPTSRVRSDELYDLAVRLAPRLAADAVPVRLPYPAPGRRRAPIPLDLADELLAHGVPLADPPPKLGSPGAAHMVVNRRPHLSRLLADPRFARELRSALHAELELEGLPEAGVSYHRHYRPHRDAERNSWRSTPGICRTPLGREVLRAWRDRQRERLRAGPDLNGLVRVLAPFVHIGGVVDELFKDEAAAREFAAVDVVALVLADLPTEADRPAIEGLMATMGPEDLIGTRPMPDLRTRIDETFPDLSELQVAQAWKALQTGVNCQEGLRRLVARLSG
ncbi:hypothetical protein CP981_29795 [Streptomyces platensis]|uniref:Uncharacterized protein n=1 Tax=Streptomyces platensis TaxID=58346 RepID=A0AAE6NLE8_STRPT|nr:hypothetical protein [Streptomyces platensis]OSY40032.1 hypothetical protein BG653_05571 [Streptomyces platensis]QEV55269.1 hypothetical protein CP981_29795 [Streptomyces platensis]